jgi:hypothetical protein
LAERKQLGKPTLGVTGGFGFKIKTKQSSSNSSGPRMGGDRLVSRIAKHGIKSFVLPSIPRPFLSWTARKARGRRDASLERRDLSPGIPFWMKGKRFSNKNAKRAHFGSS